ncbi:unnamed protein product, partial [Protopolystoma xenopodis]
MTKLTVDADYDVGETFENVPSPLSDAGNHDNYYCRRFPTRPSFIFFVSYLKESSQLEPIIMNLN